MNVLLINPSTGYYSRALFNPLGLLAIGSYLEMIGHKVKLVDRCVSRVDIKKVVDEFKPGVVGLSLMSSRGLKDAVKVSKQIKKTGITMAWGGAMPSMQPEECLESGYADYVMMGEGEHIFEELIEYLEGKRELSSILSIAYMDGGKPVRTGIRPFADLGEFPATDYSLIDPSKYMQEYLGCKKVMYFYSAKGCPAACTFCMNACFHRSTHRKRPNEIVISEIKYLYENYGLEGAYFSDELWVTKKSDAFDFCRRLKENNIDIRFVIQARIGLFNEEDLQVLYDAGLRCILFGVETGSPETMQRLNKHIDMAKIIPTFEACKRIGITTVANFILGYPGETYEQLKQTVDLAKSIAASLVPFYHFTPLPGTKLYDEVVADGSYKPPRTLRELSKTIATEKPGKNLSKVPTIDLRVIRAWFDWRAFSNKDAIEKGKPFAFAIAVIKSGLNAITKKGPIFFFIDGFKAFKEFSYVFFFSHAFPRIKKNYGLHK